MIHRAITILCLAAFAGYLAPSDRSGNARQAPAAQPRAAPPEDAPPTPQPPDGAPDAAQPPADDHDLEVQYATVYLKLAQLDLQKLLNLQNRVRGAISASQVDRVQGMVRVAEDNLRLAKEGRATRSALIVVRAKESLRTAEELLKTAQQVSRSTTTGAISDIDLDRARLTVDLERLNLARAEVAAKSDSPLDDLQWELDQMREEMMRLRYRIEAITARR